MSEKVLSEDAANPWICRLDRTHGARAEGDNGGYVWLPQWIGDKMRVNEIRKGC
jgi:hypothetical protein